MNASASKQTWQALRRRYTWHLRRPFKDTFDRSRWWEGKGEFDIEPSAALYELARRHPLVRDVWLRKIAAINRNRRGVAVWHPHIQKRWFEKLTMPNGDPDLPPSLYWTCLLGLKSWAKLDWTDRRNWEWCAGRLKGLDFRREDQQCWCLKLKAYYRIRHDREAVLNIRETKRRKEVARLVNESLKTNPPTAKEWEAAVAQQAIDAYREGQILLAVAPDMAADKAGALMLKKYREHLSIYPPARPKQRARWEDWLPLISQFEEAEAHTRGAKSQVFVHYRRALEGIRFT